MRYRAAVGFFIVIALFCSLVSAIQVSDIIAPAPSADTVSFSVAGTGARNSSENPGTFVLVRTSGFSAGTVSLSPGPTLPGVRNADGIISVSPFTAKTTSEPVNLSEKTGSGTFVLMDAGGILPGEADDSSNTMFAKTADPTRDCSSGVAATVNDTLYSSGITGTRTFVIGDAGQYPAAAAVTRPAMAMADLTTGTTGDSVSRGTFSVATTGFTNSSGKTGMVTYVMGNVSELPADRVSVQEPTNIVVIKNGENLPGISLFPSPFNTDRYFVRGFAIQSTQAALAVNGKQFGVAPVSEKYYKDSVPEGKEHEWIDLNWTDQNKDLELTVYAPDATLGPYNDTADNREDGRIFLDVASLLNVTAGDWFLKVQNKNGDSVPYTLNTYSA